jgi:hypothetical protein
MTEVAFSTAPGDGPAPAMLSIGVTGHRAARLDGTDLSHAVAATLALIEQVARSVMPDACLNLVSALADGADSMVADAALARGWALSSVLPFAREQYASDFSGTHDLAVLARLIDASARVFEIVGSTRPDAAPAGYERAGRIVLAQADILIAIWDGQPALGRGGTAQIVAEAVVRDIPVIRIDPLGTQAPLLLWDGLTDHDLGQQDIETVPRGGLDRLPRLIGQIMLPPDDPASRTMLAQLSASRPRSTGFAVAYPLLLAATGVKRFGPAPDPAWSDADLRACFAPVAAHGGLFAHRLSAVLAPRFVQADMIAAQAAQLFRSGYVANFALSAFAVILTLISLALPIAAKPIMVTLELGTIAAVLILTRTGNRSGWHRRWLDNRNLAEGLRCLAVAAQVGLGPMMARSDPAASPDWVRHCLRQTARECGLPDARIDQSWLTDVQAGLVRLIDGQIAYLAKEAGRMHLLEHRLHLAGTTLFAMTAIACIIAMAVEAVLAITHSELSQAMAHIFLVGMTMITAGLPALGAAIYGIRMQGEFASVAERAHETHDRMQALRHTLDEDDPTFDTLQRRIAHLTALLTNDTADWHRTHHARPLALPG